MGAEPEATCTHPLFVCRFRPLVLIAVGLLSGCPSGHGSGQEDAGTDASNRMCGNGKVEEGEECDDGARNSDVLADACRTDCTLPRCGDGTADTGEECDGQDLRGRTCDRLTDPDGHPYTGGVLACKPDCTYDTSSCTRCGDGVAEGEEECDGTDFKGEDCASAFGKADGQLRCTEYCLLDSTGCHTCGDHQIEGPEECEPDLPLTESCESRGYTGGRLLCDPATCRFDESDCYTCGNDIAESGEDCDGTDLRGATCSDLGFAGGTLRCTSSCHYDTSRCNTCGDGHLDPNEECDDGPANSDTQPDACRTDCTLPRCGDGVIDSNEQCDDGLANSDTQPDACRTDCTPPRCGDGVTDSGEQCDDLGQDTASCDADCTTPQCGDGHVNAASGEACDDGNTEPYDGCDACAFAEFRVNTYVQAAQERAAVSADASGNFVVVWRSEGQDTAQGGIFAQRFDASAQPVGLEFQVNTHWQSDQFNPAVSMAPDGRFVVTWDSYYQDGSEIGVFGRKFDRTGAPVDPEFQVNTYTTLNQRNGGVAVGPDGRFVVVWGSWDQDGSGWGVYRASFSWDGTRDGTDIVVSDTTDGDQGSPAVACGPGGMDNAVVVWLSTDGDQEGVFARRLAGGTEFRVNSFGWARQIGAKVAVAPDGRFVVVWMSSYAHDGNSWGIFAQRFDADGTPSGNEFQVNTYTTLGQMWPSVAMDASGRFVVVWHSEGQDGDSVGVFGQRFDADGTPLGGEFQVNTYTTGAQGLPSVAMDASGRFVVVWQSDGQDGDGWGIYASVFAADGTRRGPGAW